MPEKIFLVGMMGSGKSHLAAQLAKGLGYAAFDLDLLLETQEKKSISALFAEKGETAFRQLETQLLRSFAQQQQFVLATGGGTACFDQNMAWMNQQGLTIWLDPPLSVLAERLAKEKQHRPLIAALSDEALLPWLEQKRAERLAHYQMAHLQVTSASPDLLSLVKKQHNHESA